MTRCTGANNILNDKYLSEDVVHEAFLRIIDNIDKVEHLDSQKTRGFIFTIVKNIAIDKYRKRKRENYISYNEIEVYMKDV